jgi:NAD(P)-dependent dehydrogenase (short-subunit alcohol dehydrogenase family)
MGFQGRRAIVTGAGSGIGQATALHLLGEGARVTGVDINDAGLDPIRAAGGEALVIDLADPVQRAAVIESARQDPPQFLVNAAAILQVVPIGEVDAAAFRRHFAVNVEAVWFLCRDVGAVMAEGGAIVNFSSPSAYTLETAVYGATKTAIQGVTRTFAIHLAPRHIRVNAISPGITDTPMQEKVLREVSELRGLRYEDLSASRTNLVPLRRSASPEEMAGVVVFLLSDPAAYITGQTIYVDGGYIMSA